MAEAETTGAGQRCFGSLDLDIRIYLDVYNADGRCRCGWQMLLRMAKPLMGAWDDCRHLCCSRSVAHVDVLL